jgi:hypothetical protein
MNRITHFAIVITSVLFVFSCQTDRCEQLVHTLDYESVFISPNQLRSEIEHQDVRGLKIPGKIYFYNNLLLINELYEGIHFIDNSNPSEPKNLSFLKITGNTDFAIKDGKLYANNLLDLLTFDISDLDDIKLEHIAKNTFTNFYNTTDNENQEFYLCSKPVRTTELMSCKDFESSNNNGSIIGLDFGFRNSFAQEDVLMLLESSTQFTSNSSNGSSGTSGSMASFIIRDDYLYTLDTEKIYTFELNADNDPTLVREDYVGWGLETIFAHENELYIGSTNGMYILTLEDPAAPQYLSSVSHVGACDPVFVKDNFAYVTLRSGNICDGFTNQLDLIDISSKSNPVFVKSFSMTNPHGLSISSDELYLCDGPDGLKVFDISDPENLHKNMIEQHQGKFAFDVITLPEMNNLLIMIGAQGLVQYDFSNPNNLVELSSINIEW